MKKYLFLLLLCSQNLFPSETEGDSIIDTPRIPPIEYKARMKDFILPTALITVGTIASQTGHKDIISFGRNHYKSNDNYSEYIILGGVASSMFIFDRYVEANHQAFDQSMLFLFSAGLSMVPAYVIKKNHTEQRPDGGWESFPSGHAVTAFMIAHVFHKEFKNSNSWLAYGGYVIAAGIAGSRIIQNKHWVCDALAGAGIGILGTELAYWIYFPVRNFIAGKIHTTLGKNTSFAPIISRQELSLNLNIRF